MERILLIGIGGVYNYGCEAIVRGTETIMKKCNDNVIIDYASYRPADDKIRLKDSLVNIIERRYNRYSFNNARKHIFISYLRRRQSRK